MVIQLTEKCILIFLFPKTSKQYKQGWSKQTASALYFPFAYSLSLLIWKQIKAREGWQII